ncbi:MAG: hypothetical protein Q9M97_08915 [Candidatus Gracilibacteria bacterium]|nr:hypothetical protein [Candidatus Gracilibacteria bacterium]
MNGILSLDSNGNLIINTTVTGYGDSTSMRSGDWIELEIKDANGVIKTHKFTVN